MRFTNTADDTCCWKGSCCLYPVSCIRTHPKSGSCSGLPREQHPSFVLDCDGWCSVPNQMTSRA